jgi:hypothetical protein
VFEPGQDDGEAVAASGGDRFAIVLEFNLFPRKMAAESSMGVWRQAWRRASSATRM